jgi:CRP-like cAMP-binding protein
VRVRSPDGLEQELARLGPGEFFGEMAALTGDPRTATVAAAQDSALVAVDREAFAELFERAPEAAKKLAEVLARRREGLARIAGNAVIGPAPLPEEPHQLLDRLRAIFKGLG